MTHNCNCRISSSTTSVYFVIFSRREMCWMKLGSQLEISSRRRKFVVKFTSSSHRYLYAFDEHRQFTFMRQSRCMSRVHQLRLPALWKPYISSMSSDKSQSCGQRVSRIAHLKTRGDFLNFEHCVPAIERNVDAFDAQIERFPVQEPHSLRLRTSDVRKFDAAITRYSNVIGNCCTLRLEVTAPN